MTDVPGKTLFLPLCFPKGNPLLSSLKYPSIYFLLMDLEVVNVDVVANSFLHGEGARI